MVNGSGDLVTSTSDADAQQRAQGAVLELRVRTSPRTPPATSRRATPTRNAENRNLQTTGNYCARFDSPGQASTFAAPGAVLYYTQNATNVVLLNGQPYPDADDHAAA